MRNVKSVKADLEKKRWAFFGAGLLCATSLTLASFEWISGSSHFNHRENHVKGQDLAMEVEYNEEEVMEIPKTVTTVAPPVVPDHPDAEVLPEIPEVNPNPTPPIQPDLKGLPTNPRSNDVVGTPVPPLDTAISPIAAVMPEFPGGTAALTEFIRDELSIPSELYQYGYRGQAKVYVQFVVDVDGKIKRVGVAKEFGMGLDEAAMDVVHAMPNWKPGMDEWGRNVPVLLRLPIVVVLDE